MLNFLTIGLAVLTGAWAGSATTPPGLHAPGTPILPAVTVDVTPEGFNQLGGLASALVPSEIVVDPVSGEEGEPDWCLGVVYSVENIWVDLAITSAVITPRSGYLDLEIDLQVQVNDAYDPFRFDYELLCISDGCNAYVDPFDVGVATTIELALVTGADGLPAIDSTVGEIVIDNGLASNDINLDDCTLADIEEVLGWFGLSMFDLVLSLLEGELEGAVADMGPEIEALIDDAAVGLAVSQEMDLAGVTMQLDLFPETIDIEPEGLRIGLAGASDVAEAAECIAEFDAGGSLATDSMPPDIGEAGLGISPEHHIGAHVSDDFMNQLMYSVWRGGLLCQTVDEELTGFAIDTSFLGILAGDAFDEMFEEAAPLLIVTRPTEPPLVNYTSAHDAAITVDNLGLDFIAEVDHRQSRVLGMDVAADVGADIALDGKTGTLDVIIDLGEDALDATVAANEFVPEYTAEIEADFSSTLSGLIGQFAGSLLDGLSYAIPGFEGIGLVALEIGPAGDGQDWLGAYAWLGEVPYKSSGCDDEGGCDSGKGCDKGCEGGCTSGSIPGRGLLLSLPLMLVLIRRRP